MADGMTSGAIQGASMGSSFGPWGALIGAGAGAIYGEQQGQKIAKQQAEAAKLAREVQPIDPVQQRHLAQLGFKRRALEAGTSSMFSSQARAIRQSQAQTGANLARTTGGSTGTLIDALLRSQSNTDVALNQAHGQQQVMANQFLMAETPIIADMADRRLRLQSYARDVAATQLASMQQGQQLNTNAALATLPNIAGGAKSQVPAWALNQPSARMQADAAIAPTTMQPIQPSRMDPSPTLSWYQAPPEGQLNQTSTYRYQGYGE